MSPKFRGDENDWYDDSSGKDSKSVRKKPGKGRAFVAGEDPSLPWEESNAIVFEVYPNLCRVRLTQTHQDLLCSYRRSGLLDPSKERGRSPVVVGDRVKVEVTDSKSGVVSAVCARRNRLYRPAPGRAERKVVHVMASNLDKMAIVVSVEDPKFSPGVVDRFLVAAEAEKIQPILVISKVDLASKQDVPWKVYQDLGYTVVETSSETDHGLDELNQAIGTSEVVFCGHSGVGKTSLLRKLLGLDLKIGAVNTSTRKGKHTTSSAVRYPVVRNQQESGWIDTPGVREFSVVHLSPRTIAECFPEFREMPCHGDGCLHQLEPNCHARKNPFERYPSYLRILESLDEES